ncbi:MAG: AAA family ATPase [Candidatus Odinarchaeota archaeon]|nr:AAA family ATPase [Candidatus Odinarchaeota archaeon]
MVHYCVYQCPNCKRYTYGKCGIKYKICPYCNKRVEPITIKIVKSAKLARMKVQELNTKSTYISSKTQKIINSIFSLGIDTLDSYFKGGFYPGELTLIYGPPGTGKTILCSYISLMALKKGFRVIYLDSANTFSPKILNTLADNDINLRDLVIFQFISFEKEREFLKNVVERLLSDRQSIIIWDTIVSNVIGTFDSDVNFIILLDELMPLLKRHIVEYDTFSFITTNVISNFKSYGVKPIGGKLLKNYADNIIQLHHDKEHIIIEKVHGEAKIEPLIINYSVLKLLGV